MDKQKCDEIVEKLNTGNISESEKSELIHEMNSQVKEFNQVLEKALATIPEEKS